MEYSEIIKICYSVSDFCKLVNLPVNGLGIKKAKKIINDNNLDTSHFDYGLSKKTKYEIVEKVCPVCNKKFETQMRGDRREKKTCSHSCSNSYFRSGKDNPNWKENSTQYRTKCFEFHKKECVICGEYKIIEVHHIDENRDNNIPENLVPLCPTHHKYWHSEYKEEVEEKIYIYINNKFNK